MGSRYSREDFQNSKFYQLPKELFYGNKNMSNNERVLYSILKDRFELSIKNGWLDAENNNYFYFQQDSLTEECRMSLRTVQRALQGLIDMQLIESVRQGQNQKNRLYLLKIETQELEKVTQNKDLEEEEKEPENPVNKRTCQNDTSGHAKMTHQDTLNWRTIYTDGICN